MEMRRLTCTDAAGRQGAAARGEFQTHEAHCAPDTVSERPRTPTQSPSSSALERCRPAPTESMKTSNSSMAALTETGRFGAVRHHQQGP